MTGAPVHVLRPSGGGRLNGRDDEHASTELAFVQNLDSRRDEPIESIRAELAGLPAILLGRPRHDHAVRPETPGVNPRRRLDLPPPRLVRGAEELHPAVRSAPRLRGAEHINRHRWVRTEILAMERTRIGEEVQVEIRGEREVRGVDVRPVRLCDGRNRAQDVASEDPNQTPPHAGVREPLFNRPKSRLDTSPPKLETP